MLIKVTAISVVEADSIEEIRKEVEASGNELVEMGEFLYAGNNVEEITPEQLAQLKAKS